MDDDSRVVDKGWDGLPEYAEQTDADEAVTLSISTTPGEWLVNTVDSVVVPMSGAEIIEGLRTGRLGERSLAWRSSMTEWLALDEIPEFKVAARLPATTTQASRGKATAQAMAMPSRRATLPFGLPGPLASRATQGRLAAPHSGVPRASLREDPVLAVYARPAATISFDLSPSEPARVPSPLPTRAPPPPQTLAPLTSDSVHGQRASRSAAPYPADLSVVAASDFRAVQRSSKRLLVVSSIASAVVASLLTFWLARGTPTRSRAPAAARAPLPAATLAAPVVGPSKLVPTSSSVASEPATTPAASAAAPSTATVPASAAPTASAAPPKPKPVARKTWPVRPAPPRIAAPATSAPPLEPAAGDAVPADEAATRPASNPSPRGLLEMIEESERRARPEPEAKEPEAPAVTGSSSPGF